LPRQFLTSLFILLIALCATLPRQTVAQRAFIEKLDCGYDPLGAEDGWYQHLINDRRLKQSGIESASAAEVYDAGDIAVIEDDGSIIIPPNKFDLKNKSILFIPQGEGFRVERGDVAFSSDYGSKITGFTGLGGASNANNGSREVALGGSRFTFFGAIYDRLFVCTNGYVTFNAFDTLARPSPAALATGPPRIAPLWADLDISSKGSIYYNRLADRHLITWKSVGQVRYSGASAFQLSLYDDGRIAFVYKKIKAHASMVGLSPGGAARAAELINFSDPPSALISGPVFEAFTEEKRLDEPGLAQAFYSAHGDEFDTLYVWTDFEFDNGLGYAHAFNVRNRISGIGMSAFDRGAVYASPERLQSILTMGNIVGDWPDDPNSHVVGLNSAISIVCHEQGHRWLSYVRFEEGREVKDDLLGRDREHWSFLIDTRTNEQGSYSSLMEGNAWRESGGIFTTIESAVNHFSPLDLYLMGLLPADEVGMISYLDTDPDLKELIRSRSPVNGFSMTARRKQISIDRIIRHEGPRLPDSSASQREFRVAFVLIVERGRQPSTSTLEKADRYRQSQVRYFSIATRRLASLDSSLAGAQRHSAAITQK
jgi:hypothetical protein